MTLPHVIRSRFLSIGIVVLLALTGMEPPKAHASAPLVASPSSLRFGQIIVGQSETEVVDFTNATTSSITISGVSASEPQFSVSGLSFPITLAAGQTISAEITFRPSADQWIGGTLTFNATPSNDTLKLSVAGSGVSSVPVTPSPSSVNFGQVKLGSSTSTSVVLTNDRSWNITIKGMQVLGSGFSASGLGFPATLSPGQSVTLTVSFSPKSAGLTGGSVFLQDGIDIPLSGTGTSSSSGQLTLSPAALNFGNVDVGSTGTQAIVLSATGSSVTVSSGNSSNAEFAIAGGSFPFTINAGQSVSVNVNFAPTAGGSASGTLSFLSNASDSTATEGTSGTGVLPSYSVSLTWNASNSVVSGYNVYRGATAGGPFAKINSVLDPNTAYTDSTVVAGSTYYYVATAVNSSGQESSYSSPAVQAIIP